MRLHIVGLGPIGTLVAHHIRLSLPREHKITLIHKSKRLASRERVDGGVIRTECNGIVTSSTGYDLDVFDEEELMKTGSKSKQELLGHTHSMPEEPRESVEPLPRIESLIVTTKAQSTLSIITRLLPRLSADSTIVLLQNGLGVYERLIQNVFRNPETRPQFVLASNSHRAWLKNYSQVVHTSIGNIEFGIIPDPRNRDFEASLKDERVPARDRCLEINDITQPNDPHFHRYRSLRLTVAALSAAEALSSKWNPIREVQVTMRQKLVVNAVIGPLTALMGCRNGDLFTHRASGRIAKTICSEASAAYARELQSSTHYMLKSFGDVDNQGEVPIGRLPLALRAQTLEKECSRVAELSRGQISSMLTDVRQGKDTEIEYINGYLLRLELRVSLAYFVYSSEGYPGRAGARKQSCSPYPTDRKIRSRRSKHVHGCDEVGLRKLRVPTALQLELLQGGYHLLVSTYVFHSVIMSSSNLSCTFEHPLVLNPDISGVVLLVDRSWEDAPSALWTFIATSFGLTIAALVQAAQSNLTLFQALQVLNLVWLANFGTFLALASYSRRKSGHSHHKGKGKRGKLHKPENYVKFGAMIQTVLSMILTLWLWVHASIFNDECSPHVEYVFFVVKANALGTGRVISLILTSVLTAGYAAVTFHELRAYYRSYRQRKLPQHHRNGTSSAEKNLNISSPTSTLGLTNALSPQPISGVESNRSLSLTASISNHVIEPPAQPPTTTDPKAKKPRSKTHRPRKKQWSGNWDPMLLGIAVFQIVVFAYFVVSTELLLQWNPYQNDGNKWGFGQILALIVIIPSALALFSAFSEHGFKRLHKTRKGKPRKSKQVTEIV
ncbi:hypothetical protein PILCRDRAFT_85227 [Piloderma croceum F 1598]|uniref:Ketopantoate reductase N-terminal domain-containing protein n=1 Tax=Piloderma croceum (strain F 1598) TaxID=765440 RepID=A0A0C3FWY5_PILCF|nr:hypothetical protein PILCRDRAFT_85227 [Piloderma croceum F 1598]